MKLQTYIKKNWNRLPKSNFNDDVVVIVRCLDDRDEGWGNHYYAGIGIDKDGKVFNCTSSGCSCQGSCGISPVSDEKRAVSGLAFEIDFDSLQVSFHDYE